MDTQIDLEEAYSVETKVKKPTFKLPEGPKKLEFFSKIGQTRLLRICEDNKLDDEILFTGWVGPSDSFVREQVSDHVQHYLFKRAKRVSVDRELSEIISKQVFPRREKKFQNYEDYVKQRNEIADQSRVKKEMDRIKRLLISGEITTAPVGFDYITSDPIYRVNRLTESVRNLGSAKIKHNFCPFALRHVPPIRNVNEITEGKDRIITSIDTFSAGINSEALSLDESSLSGFESISSGFEEITPSPIRDSGVTLKSFSTDGYIVDFSSDANHTSHNHEEILDDENPEELSSCSFEDISGDLEIDLQPRLESDLIKIIKNQNTCHDLYKTGSDLVDMYLRQQVVGSEFMERFSATYFKKQLV